MSAVSVALHVSSRVVDRVVARTSVVFAAAMALVLVHLVDDAFVDAPDGTSLGSNLATIAVPAIVAVALAVGAARLRPGMRAWLAVVAGAVAAADGGLHLAHVKKSSGLSGSDITGLVSGLGGVALLAVAVALVFRPRAPRAWKRRWGIRLAAVLGTAGTAVFVILPITVGV